MKKARTFNKGENIFEMVSLFIFISDLGCLHAVSVYLSYKRRKPIAKLSIKHAVICFTKILGELTS